MPYYPKVDNKMSTILIPSLQGDPDIRFFNGEIGTANCYAYALNLFDVGSINPAYSKNESVHGGLHTSTNFQAGCEVDGMEFNSKGAPVGELFVTGQYYMAALFGNAGDMHWSRVDSNGTWTDKMPRGIATYSSFQEDALAPHEVSHAENPWTATLNFIAYYRVYPARVAKGYAAYVKSLQKGCCVIL